MKPIRVAGIAWGLIYFAIGIIFSFTLGGDDFWSGAVVYLSLFLLPLPIALVALWFPRTAGTALIGCAVVSITVSAMGATSSHQTPDLGGLFKFTMFHVPHLAFALAYINTGRIGKQVDSEDKGRSVGAV